MRALRKLSKEGFQLEKRGVFIGRVEGFGR